MKNRECKELKEIEANSAKKISISFFILLVFFAQVIITDTIIYFSGMRYIIANAIALVPNIILIIFLIKKQIIKLENNFNQGDIIFLTIIFIVTALTIVFPDEFWDSYSYHIYLQQDPFADKINDDFFPGRTLTSFVFPIADRVFCMFRSILGFRLGTLPGYLLLIVMFYQIKKILKQLINKEIKEIYLSILSMLPLGTFVILQQIGTYYIDNFSIVILLEVVYAILYDSDEIFKNKSRLYYLAFIVGIGVCIKITNAIYMILPLIYLLIKNIKDIKQIKWYDYICLVITAFIPMLPYFLDAVIQTGSPVFPYYNTIFQSEYFAQENWLDDRYGPKNIIQFLLWPLYILKHPQKAYELGETDFSFASGYIVAIIYLIYLLYKKIIKKEKLELTTTIYILNLLYFYIVWEKFIIGYTRYAGVIAVLSTILIIKVFVNSVKTQKIVAILILSGTLMMTAYQGIYQYAYYGSPINYVSALQGNISSRYNIKVNMYKLFKDRENLKYDIDGVWGVIYDDSAVPTLLNVDDRLVHLEYGFKTGESEISQKIYWDNVLNNDIYVPLYSFKLQGKLDYFDRFGFKVTEIVDIITNPSFLQWDAPIYIVKVEYDEEKLGGNKDIFDKLEKELIKQNQEVSNEE